METAAVRKKLYSFIDEIPDDRLLSVETLLSYFAGESANVPVTEISLTDEEIKWLQEGSEHHKQFD